MQHLKIVKHPQSQEQFIQSVEGIGEILAAAVGLKKTAVVRSGLKQLNELFDAIQELRIKDINQFEKLILTEDILSRAEKDPEAARFELHYNPSKHAIGLQVLIDQFLKVHKAAIATQHDEASRYSIYHLNDVLAKATIQTGNGLIVRQILNALSEAAQLAMKMGDRSMYAAGVHWYTDTLFTLRRNPEKRFELEYLQIFNDRFFQIACFAIKNRHNHFFSGLVSSLVDGIMPDMNWEEAFWAVARFDVTKDSDFDPNLYSQRISKLLTDGYSEELQGKLFLVVDEISSLVKKNAKKSIVDAEFLPALQSLKNSLSERIKYDELIRLGLAIGAYCVSQEAEEQLVSLWEYKQPDDADAHYVGHDIIPSGLNRIFSLFYSGQVIYRDYEFHDGHHGTRIYFDRYLVLLLARNAKRNNDDRLNYINNPLILHRIWDSTDHLQQYAREMSSTDIWRGVLKSNGGDLLEKVISQLSKAKESSKSHLDEYVVKTPIAESKLSEFQQNFIEEFESENISRKLLAKYGIYTACPEIQAASAPNSTTRGIKEVANKEPFLRDWYSTYMDTGKPYGRRFAITETEYLAEKLLQTIPCLLPQPNIAPTGFLDSLHSAVRYLEKSGHEATVILSSYDVETNSGFRDSPDYIPQWDANCPKSDIRGYAGCLKHENRLIPIFWVGSSLKKIACVLDLKKIGEWFQYSPIESAEDIPFKHNDFYLRIESFGQSEKALTDILDQNPPWLKNHQDPRGYLLRNVLLTVRESFEYRITDSMAGVQVCFRVNEENE